MTSAWGAFEGAVYRRGDDGYDAARRGAIWNGRKPDRFPDVIAVVANEDDVVRAVHTARDEGLKIGIRSGGHSFYANGIRDGGLLLDLSRLDDFVIDVDSHTASIGPATRSQAFQRALNARGYWFPTGTCPTTGSAGYLLGGGFSWAQRDVGIAASRIRAIDVVTADGERTHADDETNSEWLWAARGGGPAFFGVITRFYLEIRPLPIAMLSAVQIYSVEQAEEVIEWYTGILPTLDPRVSAVLFAGVPPNGELDEVAIMLPANVFADSDAEARRLLEHLESSPLLSRATVHRPPAPWAFDDGYAVLDAIYPEGRRYIPDCLWCKPEEAGFAAALAAAIRTIPGDSGHIICAPFLPREHPNASFSVATTMEVSVLGVGDEETDDGPLDEWVQASLALLRPHSIGAGKISGSNPLRNPTILSDENSVRFEALRDEHDPDRLFHLPLGVETAVAAT